MSLQRAPSTHCRCKLESRFSKTNKIFAKLNNYSHKHMEAIPTFNRIENIAFENRTMYENCTKFSHMYEPVQNKYIKKFFI